MIKVLAAATAAAYYYRRRRRHKYMYMVVSRELAETTDGQSQWSICELACYGRGLLLSGLAKDVVAM
jgi:hypothetical protein